MRTRLADMDVVLPIKPFKRAPRDAENELLHLEAVLKALSRSDACDLPLGPKYWTARVRDLDDQYALLQPQRARLTALLQIVDALQRECSTGATGMILARAVA